MYQKILVPLDGSQRAEAILPHVVGLAQCTQASVILIQVVEHRFAMVSPYDVLVDYNPQIETEELVAAAEQYLDEMTPTLTEKEIETRTIVKMGPIVAGIIEAADEEDADLIAMASHGRTGLSRVFYGSVAAGVLQRVDRPLLLIRAPLPQ